jgi:gamma-glutamyltranspeptidase/glutathione hydrolase
MTAETMQRYIRDPGPKESVRDAGAVCSTDSAIVTETVLRILAAGGTAADAGIAGAMVQAAVEPFLTNHTGTVSLLYYEAATGRTHQLHSAGTFPPHLAPFRPMPQMAVGYARMPPAACIPGFMPGMKAIYGRFGTLPWSELCADAVRWAAEGHPVSSFEYGVNLSEMDFVTHFPEGRKFYLPNGYLPVVGEIFGNQDMARTLKAVSVEGPDHMISGAWAADFVAKADAMGWPIALDDMSANPPRWVEPLRFPHGADEIVSLAPPEQQGVFLAMVLGILDHAGIRNTEQGSAEHIFLMSHALRLGLYFCGFTGDPVVAAYQSDQLLDGDFHRTLARLVLGMKPHHDLTRHLELTGGPGTRLDGHGLAGIPSTEVQSRQPPGSCELSIVDKHGNWLQLMNTLQSGGIPGMVVGGIPMIGSHATFAGVSGHFDIKLVPGARLRTIVGHTFIMRDGKPRFGLGTPGNVFCTVPQVVSNLLDFGMTPEAAIEAPRQLQLNEDYSVIIEDRVPAASVRDLAGLGVKLSVMPPYDWHMGSFQMCFRDPGTGRLGAVVDPRRCGLAGGLA